MVKHIIRDSDLRCLVFFDIGDFFVIIFSLNTDASIVSPELSPVFQRFYDALPDRPRATDYLEVGSLPCPKIAAIQRRYIQFNKKNYWVKYLTYDLDYEGSSLAWYDLDLPAPTLITINPSNGHAHLSYELDTPVHLGGHPSRKAIYYLEVIRQGYTQALQADTAYTGLLSKNPLSNHWEVQAYDVVYDLFRLAEPLRSISWKELEKISLDQLEEKIKRSKIELPTQRDGVGFRQEYAERGRNCFCFEHARFYSYEIVKNCKTQSELEKKVKAHIDQLNTAFEERLPESEMRSTSRSITKWTWDKRDHFIQTSQKFSERQKERQLLSAATRKKKNEQEIRKAMDRCLKEGIKPTQKNIAELSGLGIATIKRHWSSSKIQKGIISQYQI